MESTREEGAWIDGRGEQGGGVGDGPKRALGTFGDNGEPWGVEQPRMGPHRHVHEEASKSSMRRAGQDAGDRASSSHYSKRAKQGNESSHICGSKGVGDMQTEPLNCVDERLLNG